MFDRHIWHSCIRRAKACRVVSLWRLLVAMPVFFVLFVRFIGCGVTQNDDMLAVFVFDAIFGHPITDRFPFHEGCYLLLRECKGYTADECIFMSRLLDGRTIMGLLSYRPCPSNRHIIQYVSCANFYISFMERTFHVPVQILVLGPNRLYFAPLPFWCRL